MTACAASVPRAAATESPLLGFLERVPPGGRYAIYPLGAYTRAALEDVPVDALRGEGRRLIGLVDDGPECNEHMGTLAAPLHTAATWPLDALLLLRDTHDRRLSARIDALKREGLLRGVQVVEQPAPYLAAMLAHLQTYHPECRYESEFVSNCRRVLTAKNALESRLFCTLDAEVFPNACNSDVAAYPAVMGELCRVFAAAGFSFTLCVQLEDSPGGMRRTPDDVVHRVLDAFGPSAIGLHGVDHAMPAAGYSLEWFERGLALLLRRYGVQPAYWAPPGWTLGWRTLRVLEKLPRIRAVRGIWTGVNTRQLDIVETLRTPYRAGTLWQIPYSYVDWMFMDLWSRPLPTDDLLARHEQLAEFAAAQPCRFETIAHPFRLVGSDWRERLRIVRQSLESYTKRGVRISSVESDGWLSEPTSTNRAHSRGNPA